MARLQQTARIPRAGRAVPCPPCAARCSQRLPEGIARIPGAKYDKYFAGARGSLGELFPRRKSPTRDGGTSYLSGERDGVFPVIPSCYRSPPVAISAGKTTDRSFYPQDILAGVLCLVVPPSISVPFVLLLAGLRNHSLWKHLSTMDWIEHIQASCQ